VLGLEELYLANLIVRKNLVPAEDVRSLLEAMDREPARGDLYARLASQGGNLAQPEMREKAMAAVNRYMFSKKEAAFAERVRTSGAVPPAFLDQVVAEQKTENLGWSIADRLVKENRLSTVRCSLLQKEAGAELKKQEQDLVARHRSSRFRETVTPGAVAGKRTKEYGNLESSSEGNILPAVAPGDDGERTMKLSPQVASGLQPLEEAQHATIVGGRDAPPPGSARRAPQQQPGPVALGSILAGKYEIVSELGRGGMGVVYRARSSERMGDVALKAVPATKGAKGPAADALARFKREILTATLVTSENVCEVYDAGEAENLVYMAMELIEGTTLRDLIKAEAPLPTERSLALFEQLLKGVGACHAANVVHRDLKPDNVRVTPTGVAKIVDFGIARLVSTDTMIAENVFVTIKGTLSGTPAYVAPELVMEPDLIDARADLYSLGVILYELLTGKLPYVAKATIRETLRDALEARPIPLEEAAPQNPVPPEVQRILFKLLEKDQLVRFQSAKDVIEAITEVRKPSEPPSSDKKKVNARTRARPQLEKQPGFFARLFAAIFGGKKTS
jgi:serine/threonine-protein kinase